MSSARRKFRRFYIANENHNMNYTALLEHIQRHTTAKQAVQATAYDGDPHAGLMTTRNGHIKYALDEAGNVQGLNLSDCELDDAAWQQILKVLSEADCRLRDLNLSGNRITRFSFTPELELLEHLDISENKALQTIAFSGPLLRLERWVCTQSGLQEIALPALPALKGLDLSRNKLAQVSFEGACPMLEWLDMSYNALQKLRLPKGFQHLKQVYLQKNQLEQLQFDEPLRKLTILHLRSNKLSELPDNLLSFSSLKELFLHDNAWRGNLASAVPKEEYDNAFVTVRDYLRELSKGKVLNERVKIIIVGNGRVGKTSMLRRLKGLSFRKDEKFTHGVQLGELDKENLPKVKTLRLSANVWDFGGQEIFYATHQFFLTDDALYILAWTAEQNVLPYRERDKEHLPFGEKWRSREYWLENIRHHAPAAPVLMVQTHCDSCREPYNPLAYSIAPYLSECMDFDAESNEGLSRLQRLITERLNTAIPPYGETYPETYDRVIGAVEERQNQNKITRAKFDSICREAGITQGGEVSVLEFLRVTGTVVWFPHVKALKDTIFVNPNWITKQVYRLINNALQPRKGHIDEGYVGQILPEYTQEERDQFLELLQNFELIFKEDAEGKEVFIAPQYLPEKLEGETQTLYEMIRDDLEESFVFRFPKFVPDNVMINFLSRYGPFSRQMYWKTGICFNNERREKCIVNFDENSGSLRVFTKPASVPLQAEVCRAFVELSKNANAEIALAGRPFVSWQELEAAFKDKIDKIRAVDGSPVEVQDYERFFDGKDKEPKPPMRSKIFISYAHKDEAFKDELVNHLSALKNQGLIEAWHDRQIESGFWDDQIKAAMEESDIFLLLITSNFISSKYISEIEITTAYRKFKAGEAKIFPVICDFCQWQLQPLTQEDKEIHPVLKREMGVWLGKFQPYPKDGKPVTDWDNRNKAYLSIIESLLKEVL